MKIFKWILIWITTEIYLRWTIIDKYVVNFKPLSQFILNNKLSIKAKEKGECYQV